MMTIARIKDIEIKMIENGGFCIRSKGKKYFLSNMSLLRLIDKASMSQFYN